MNGHPSNSWLNPPMPIHCQLYAVEADQIEPMKFHPALVLGRGILAGLPSCHLKSSVETLQELLRDDGRDLIEPVGFLLSGGYRLCEVGDVSTDSRLLAPQDVQAFDQQLQLLTEAELFRRFNRLAILAAGVDALHLLEPNWEDDDEFEGDDWTLDQAEEYETLAEDFEKLRAFIGEAARQNWGVVIAGNRETP